MPTLTVNAVSLYYEQLGSGPDVFFIGPALGGHDLWNPLRAKLSQHCRLTVFDNRGTARSEVTPGEYSTELMAEDSVALMDALEIKQAVIVGYSLGGMIAQHIALQHPGRIRHLVLSNCVAKASPVEILQMDVSAMLMERDPTCELMYRNVAPWIFGPEYLSRPRGSSLFVKAGMLDPNKTTLAGFVSQQAATRMHDLRDCVKNIAVPTTVIAGEDDLITRVEAVRWLAEQIPNAKFKIMKKAGHIPFVEKTQEYSDILLSVAQQA